MKKLIAISITLALIASAAFAQVTVGGLVQSKWVAFSEIPGDGDDTVNSLSWTGRVQLDGKTEGDIFGGSLRITPSSFDQIAANQGKMNKVLGGGVAFDWAYVWWQPIQQVKLQLGTISDGFYGVDAIAAWGFHGDANDFVAYDKLYNTAAFAGGALFTTGASFVITPLDGLKVVFGIPTEASISTYISDDKTAITNQNAMEAWKHFFLQAGYDLPNIGVITLTYKSGKQDKGDVSQIYASFQLKMIENLGLHFGVNYNFPGQYKNSGKDAQDNSPITLGLAADYGLSDTFGVKARLAFSFLGSEDDGSTTTDKPYLFDLEVLPYYDLSIFKAYLSLGMRLHTDEEQGSTVVRDAYVDFLVNPYIEKTVGAGSFFAGFQLIGIGVQDGTKKSSKYNLTWAIPVGLQYAF
jgi:hypothetical protein